METTVAVDCMGGDHGPHVTVPAVLAYQRRHADVDVLLVGQRDAIEAELSARRTAQGPRLRVHHASEVVAMDEPLATALRSKKDSSMRVATDLVKSGTAHACEHVIYVTVREQHRDRLQPVAGEELLDPALRVLPRVDDHALLAGRRRHQVAVGGEGTRGKPSD